MIHSGSPDYLIIIPSGAWDRLSCHWHITHRLFFFIHPFPALSLHPSIYPKGLGDDPPPWRGVVMLDLCDMADPRRFLCCTCPPCPTPVLQPATATRLAFDLIPA